MQTILATITESIELVSSRSLLFRVTVTVLSISCFTAFHPIASNADQRQLWSTLDLWEGKGCIETQLSAVFTSNNLTSVRFGKLFHFFILSVPK